MMSAFPKVERCKGVKIWSRGEIDSDMINFGWSAFNAYQRDLEKGAASEGGCLYSNQFYSCFCKKTKSGICSAVVANDGVNYG